MWLSIIGCRPISAGWLKSAIGWPWRIGVSAAAKLKRAKAACIGAGAAAACRKLSGVMSSLGVA
jgi:hypothetical protein